MMRHSMVLIGLVLACLLGARAAGAEPDERRVFFIGLDDKAVVNNPVLVRFGVHGMKVVPAGEAQPDAGHHHLLIDVDELPPLDQPLPATEQIVHFGQGQSQTELSLSPGQHSLQLLFADHLHVPHDPPVMSKKIVIHVRR